MRSRLVSSVLRFACIVGAIFALLSAIVSASPVITSFTPTTLAGGITVTITGSSFLGATAVKFNGVNATSFTTADSQITAVFPAGAAAGNVSVTTPAGTATSSGSYSVTTAPIITSVTPASGGVGSVVTVSGANFGTISNSNPVITVNGISATQRTAGGGGFRFVVPTGATTGPLAITVGGVAATSTPTFTVETSGTPPANDNFANAQVIANAGGSVFTDNLFATKESGEPAHGTTGGASVWFRWTAPSSGAYIFSQGGSVIGAFLAIYEGSAVNALTLKATGKPGNTSFLTGYGAAGFVATAGTTYHIAVDGHGGTKGSFALQWGTLAAPTIASFTPTSAYAGASLTITGTDFVNGSTVTVAGVPVVASTTSSTSITVGALPAILSPGPVVVTTAAGSATSTAEFTVRSVPEGGGRALRAQSARLNAGGSSGPVLMNFTIEGAASKSVLVRAAGPALAAYGIGGVLADPKLEVYNGRGQLVAQNDNWSGGDGLAAATSGVGAFAFTAGSLDAAALVTLAPGTYTVKADGVGGASGAVLVELYDAEATERIPYLSTHGQVGAGSAALIGGFVVGGTAPQRLLVRAIGPALGATGVAGTLANPKLEIYASNGALLATNDNWGTAESQSTLAAAMVTAGLIPLADGSNDAALLIDLVPGNYTVQVAGVGGTTGRALLEVAQIDVARGPVLPALIAPPQTASLATGAAVTFAAPAVGRPVYQWSKGGTPISGATGAALSLSGVDADAAGNYTVAMTGAGTTTVSVDYVLNVAPPSAIATVPANGTVVAGSSITLTAQPVGTGPFTYQWRKFGQAISGATNVTFTLPAATMFDAGLYDVAITPSGGSAAVSAPVQVTVQPAGAPLNAATVVPASTFDALVEYDGADVQFLAGASDGKVYVSGYFSSVGGVPRRGFARLLADGTVDAAFVPAPVDNTVWAVAVQPDGKVLVGGDFYLIGGRSGPGLARLNADGSLDHSFRPAGLATGSVYAIALQSDGKIVVGGADFQPGGNVLRLNADGSRDGTFATGAGFDNEVFSLVLQPDGKIVAGGPFNAYNGAPAGRIARLNTDGSRDTAFAPGTGFDNRVFWMARQSDGKIVVAGEFSTFAGTGANRIARLNPVDGSVDAAFATATGTGFAGGRIDMIVLQNDGKIVAGGGFSSFNGTSVGRIARLLDTGALDTGFAVGTGSNRDVSGLAVLAGGAILAETDGSATFNGVAGGPVVRLSAGGVHDTGYVLPVREPGSVYALVPAPGGKWLIGGNFEFVNGVARKNFARLNANGSPDGGFTVGTGFNSNVDAILVQPDGRVVVGGGFTTYNGGSCNRLVRLTDTGGLDGTFDVGAGFNSSVRALAQQADGKILVGGWFSTYRSEPAAYLVRLNADGSRDAAFGTPGTGFNNVVHALVVRPDGDIYVGGNFTHHESTPSGRIARLNANGTLDAGFAPGAGFDTAVYAVAVQTDGRVVVGGQFGFFNSAATPRIARLNTDGTRDGLFATAGFSGTVYDVALQADGRIMAAGYIYRYGSDPTDLPSLVRLNADGTRDYGFVLPGVPPYEQILKLRFTGTGGLIYAGGSTYFPSRATAGVALLGPAVVPAFSQQPAAAVALTAGQAGGSLTVSATDAVAYQWRRDGVPIPGAVGQTYSFPTATMGMAGRYDIVVTSADGVTATSGAAVVTVAPSAYPTALTVDAAFDVAFERELSDAFNDPITAVAALPGGKFVVAGPFSRIGNTQRSRLARFNADGSLDLTWNPPAVAGQIDALAVQGDGKILLGGTFFRIGNVFRNGLARLNADGTLDATAFAGPAPGSVQALAVLPDGKILAGGMFSNTPGGIDRNALARFSAEGVFDPAFNASIGAGGNVRALAVQTVGGATKIVVGGTFATVGGVARGNVARVNADGTLDTAFSVATTANGTDAAVNALAIDSGNGVLVGGAFANFSGTAARALVRLAAADGARDAAFAAAAGGSGFGSGSVVYALAVMADGKIAVGSNDTEFNGNETGALIRLTAAGALDSNSTTYVNASVMALAAPRADDGGGVILGGSFSYFYEFQTARLARVTSGWERDAAVVHTFYAPAHVRALAHGLSGDVYVGGNFTHVGGQPRNALVRLLPGGSVDAAFNAGGVGFEKGASVTGLAPVGDGRMTVIGSFYSYRGSSRVGLVRILPDGVTDSAFNIGTGPDQPPAAVLALPGGRVLVAGPFSYFKGNPRNGLAVLMPDGSLDSSYLNPVAPIPGGDLVLARQNDDRILIGGNFTSFAGTPANRLVRLHANGVLDTDFTAGVGTGPSHAVNALAVLPDGKILAAGGFTSWGENTAYRFIARLNSGGGIDGTFVPPTGSSGSAGFGIQSLLVQADGRILVRGLSGLGISNTFGFGRLAAGGAADATFAVSGIASISSTDRSMLLLGDGSLLVGVSTSLISDTAGPRHGLARLAPASAPTIAVHPQSQVALVGQTVTFSVTVNSVVTPTYQWRRNTVPIDGATSASLVMPNVTTGSIGTYDVLVTVGGGTAIPSNPAFLAIGPAASAGVVERGGSVSFSVDVTGLPTSTFQWQRSGVNLDGQTGATLVVTNANDSSVGTYRVIVSNSVGSVTSGGAPLVLLKNSLLTLSARHRVRPRGEVSASFTIQGSQPKRVLIRGVGPALAALDIGDRLADPQLRLFDRTGAQIAANDDWGSVPANPVGATPVFVTGSKDAAIEITLGAGTYTAVLNGAGGAGGVAFLQIYDRDADATPRFTMLTTRGHVGTGENVVTVGFTVGGTESRKLLFRSPGWRLLNATHDRYESGILSDPMIGVYSGATQLAFNDDWDASEAELAAVAAAGAQPFRNEFDNSNYTYDATVLIELQPGNYTAQLLGYNNSVGESLLEIFEVDAYLAATAPPALTWVPSDQPVLPGGGGAVFSATAAGKPGVSFQWRRNGTPIAGATHNILDFPSVTDSDVATAGVPNVYDVVATNSAGSVTSPGRRLRLLPEFHSADTNRDSRIGLFELTRVIELYNHRSSGERTGEYRTQTGTEDGYRNGPGAITVHHSADWNRDGRIGLDELLRVIELYNVSEGSPTVRTGRYIVSGATEDGFEPAAAPLDRGDE